jgi:signal transduction histidine kinase
MNIFQRIEKILDLDRIEGAGTLVRARAVYVMGFTFVFTQIANQFAMYTSYGGFTLDHLISACVSLLVLISIYNLRYKLSFRFYAVLFSVLIITATVGSAVPDQTGINSALLPFFVLGTMANGFICGARAVAMFCVVGLATIWYLYSVSMGAPAGFILDPNEFAERNFQRAFQASLALSMVSVVCAFFSHSMHEAFQNLESGIETAQENDRAKTQFLANMSHEFRTPMNGILGISEILMETDLDAEQTELTALINQSGETLVGLISDVLLFSQIESGTVELSDDVFELKKVLLEAVAPHRVMAAQKNLPIYLSIAPHLVQTFRGDAIRLRHAVSSVVGNAVKFTNNGRIDISAMGSRAADGKYRLVLTVKDTGIGIAEDKLPIIFDRFRQADESRKRLHGGTGLGLTVARGLVSLMDGDITAMSRESAGSIFCITVDLEMGDKATSIDAQTQQQQITQTPLAAPLPA